MRGADRRNRDGTSGADRTMAAGTGRKLESGKPRAERPPRGAAMPWARPDVQRVADLLRFTSDPTRVQLLLALAEGERDVAALGGELGTPAAALSHHLAMLRHGRLIQPRRVGKRNVYSLTDPGRELVAAFQSLIVGKPAPDVAPPAPTLNPRRRTPPPDPAPAPAPLSVDDLIALPDADWIPRNGRRGDLIQKKIRQGLDAEERDELERLQAASIIRTRRDFPAPTRLIEEIRALKAQLRGDTDAK